MIVPSMCVVIVGSRKWIGVICSRDSKILDTENLEAGAWKMHLFKKSLRKVVCTSIWCMVHCLKAAMTIAIMMVTHLMTCVKVFWKFNAIFLFVATNNLVELCTCQLHHSRLAFILKTHMHFKGFVLGSNGSSVWTILFHMLSISSCITWSHQGSRMACS